MKLTKTHSIGGFQMKGNRSYQEDRFLSLKRTIFGKKIFLLALADGMGGHKAGDIAAEIAIREIKNFFEQLNSHLIGDLKKGFEEAYYKANSSIRDYASNHEDTMGMGTTLTCALIVENKMIAAHIGDSRAYIVSQHGLYQCTKDHSAYQEALDSGIDVSKISVGSNAITRCLDGNDDFAPDFSAIYDIHQSLVFVSSDGFHEVVSEDEIKKIAGFSENAEEFAKQAVERAIANKSNDNVTVAAVALPGRKVQKFKGVKRKRRKKTAAKVLVSVATLLLMVTISFGIWGDQFFQSIHYEEAAEINSPTGAETQDLNQVQGQNNIIDHTDIADRPDNTELEESGEIESVAVEAEPVQETIEPEEDDITFNKEILSQSFTEAHIQVEIANVNNASVLNRGVCWGTESLLSEEDNCKEIESEESSFTGDIANLNPGTTYFYRPYIQLSGEEGKIWGETGQFTTNRLFEELHAVSVTDTSVTIGGIVHDADNIQELNLCYGTDENVEPGSDGVECIGIDTETGNDFSKTLEYLPPSTQFYVNVFANHSGMEISMDEISFTTDDVPQALATGSEDDFGLLNSIVAELNEVAFCIQVSAFDDYDGAKEFYSEVLNEMYRVQILDSEESEARYKVCVGQFLTDERAKVQRNHPHFLFSEDGPIRNISNFKILK